MLRVGYKQADNYIFNMCPYCFKVMAVVMKQPITIYRKCYHCGKYHVEPKSMFRDPFVRVQWHYDKDII